MHPTNWEISELKGIIDHHVGVDDSATFNNSSNPLPLPPSSSSSSSSFIPYFPFSASSELLNSPNILSWTSGLMEDQLQPSSSLFQSSSSIFQTEPHAWRFNEPTKTQTDLSSEMEANSCGSSSSLSIAINGPRICREEQKRSCSDSSVSDGYRWRKYGEKQVKGSENPRSYYKCSNPNCSMRKKVERNLEGEITEIEYKGSHNHPKPEACGRNSLIQSMASEVLYSSSCANSVSRVSDTAMREDGSVSVEEEDCFERTSQSCHSGGDEDVFGPQAKRWKGEKNENDGDLSRSVKEPRVVVQTISEIDLLDDGYRWRKYGQKVVKTNPNPRSYYKCTSQGCGVRKHVERAANDAKSVITTYEGKHNHVVPPSRGRSLGYNTNTTLLNGNDVGANPIRPSANYSTFMNSPYNARLPPTYPSPQEPFALEMFHNQAASLGFSGFGRSTSSDTDRVQEDRYTK